MNPSVEPWRLGLWAVAFGILSGSSADLPFHQVLTGGGGGYDVAYGLAVDGQGRRWVVGEFSGEASAMGISGESAGPSDGFLLVLGTDDRVEWGLQIGGAGLDSVLDVAVDAAGQVYLAGGFEGTVDFGAIRLTSEGGRDAFVAKLDARGEFVWARGIGGAEREEAVSLGVDGAGNVVVAGEFSGSIRYDAGRTLTSSEGEGVFVVKYDAEGRVVWGEGLTGTGAVAPFDLAVGTGGSTTLVGWFDAELRVGSIRLVAVAGNPDEPPAVDAFVARLDSAGRVAWAVQAGGSSSDGAMTVAVDAQGNSHVGGGFGGTASFGGHRLTTSGMVGGFVGRLSAAGEWTWVRGVTSAGPCWVGSVAFDPAGSLYAAGASRGMVTGLGAALEVGEGPRLFVAKLDGAGQVLHAGMLAAIGEDGPFAPLEVEGIVVPAVDEFHVVGQFRGGLALGTNAWSNAGDGDGFLASGGIYAMPAITAPPVAATAASGSNVVLRVAAAGGGLRYQWMRDGVPLPEATRSTLELAEIQSVHEGQYAVQVSNPRGMTTSAAVAVRVTPPATGFEVPEFRHESLGSMTYDGPYRSVHDGRGRVYLFSGVMNLVNGRATGMPFRLREQDGSWDPGFDLGPRFGNVTAMTVDADGRVLLASADANGATVWRFVPTGATDRSFTPFRSARPVRFLVVQRDGRILVAATLPSLANVADTALPPPSILRLNPDGTPDAGFRALEFDASLLALRWPPLVDGAGRIYLAPFPASVRVRGEALVGLGRALPDGQLDADYHPFATYPGGLDPYPSVRAFGFQSDGSLVVAGSFTPSGTFGLATRRAVLRFTEDGRYDPTFAEVLSSRVGGTPLAMVVLPDDTIAVAGARLAFVPRDGALNQGFVEFEVDSLSSWMSATADGRVLLPGTGTVEGSWVGGPTLWTREGRDRSFAAPRFASRVHPASLAVSAEGRLALAGGFNRLGAASAPHLALLRLDDGQAAAGQIDPGLGHRDDVRVESAQVVEGPGGRFYGLLRLLNADPELDTNALVRVGADGRTDSSFRSDSVQEWVDMAAAIHATGDGRLLLTMEGSGGAALRGRYAIRLDEHGQYDPSFVAELPEPPARYGAVVRDFFGELNSIDVGGVRMLGTTPEGGWLVAATTTNGTTRVIRWDREGVLDRGFAGPEFPDARWTLSTPMLRDPVHQVTVGVSVTGFRANTLWQGLVLPDARVLLAGEFREVAGRRVYGLVRLLADGTLDPTFEAEEGPRLGAEPGIAGGVTALAMDSLGRVYLGGLFDRVGSMPAPGLARLLPDGSPDPTFIPPIQMVDYPAASARLRLLGSRLLVLGTFAPATNVFPSPLWSLPVTGNGPTFVEQPLGGLVRSGDTVELRSRAVGDGPVTYQWRRDGIPIPGATQAVLRWRFGGADEAGQYSVSASDRQGTSVSLPTTVFSRGGLRLSATVVRSNPGELIQIVLEDGAGGPLSPDRARNLLFEVSPDLRSWNRATLPPVQIEPGRVWTEWNTARDGGSLFLRAVEP